MTVGAALVLAGCGTGSGVGGTTHSRSAPRALIVPRGHPHAVEPVAGAVPSSPGSAQPSPGSALPLNTPAPTGPASVTRAPAAGAPTDAEVRAAVARFQAAVARYHLDRLNLSGALINPSTLAPGGFRVSTASVYTDYGRPIACGGVLHVPELGVANKTLPCGTEVTFVYGHRAVRVPVIDRGPYIPGRRWDLTGATAEALHFPGLGPIAWRIG